MADDSSTTDGPTDDQQQSATDDAGQQGKTDQRNDDGLGDAGKKALDAMKTERREAVNRAKALERELADLKAASMSQAEKELAAAKLEGRNTAIAEYGKELARSAFDVAAARRNADFDTTSALEWVDVARFVGEDGKPDAGAIKAAVERLVPAPTTGPPSFDGGPRTSAPKGADMNQLMRQRLGRE